MDKIEIIPPTRTLIKEYKNEMFLARVGKDQRHLDEAKRLKASIKNSMVIDAYRMSMKDLGRLR